MRDSLRGCPGEDGEEELESKDTQKVGLIGL